MGKETVADAELLNSALKGLRASPKVLEPKWFYDAAGSALFERITELPEYYPTRTELAILRNRVAELAPYIPQGAALVELGSGASTKTRLLLDALPGIAAYVPIDVSADFLQDSAAELDRAYAEIEVVPLAGDFMAPLRLREALDARPKVGFFPGSTIGNLEPAEAADLLRRVRQWRGVSAFVVGMDLVKDRETLIRAYDDSAGVTAAFNRNLLHRLNRDAGADFDPDAFDHEARWNEKEARIEMHLVSRRAQAVRLGPATIAFAAGESIRTENSHKYTHARLAAIASRSGWRVAEFLTDKDEMFAVAVLVPGG